MWDGAWGDDRVLKAKDLEIDLDEPYVEIKTLNQKNSFIIGKAKMFEEEKEVANKVPVEGIEIKNISVNKSLAKGTKSNSMLMR